MNKETEFLWAIKHGTTSKTFLIAPMTDHCPLWVLPTYVFRDDKLAEQQLREMKLESPNRYVNFDTSEIPRRG